MRSQGWAGSATVVAAIAIALLFVLSIPIAAPSSAAPGHAIPSTGSLVPSTRAPVHGAVHPALGPAANGRGLFFDSTVLANVTNGTETCFVAGCTNVSNDPSMNWTSYGTIAVAYTAWTNASPCAAAIPYAESEVGVVVSTNGGSSWSSPTYLGAPSTCSAATAAAEPSAWQPSVTSLANGTLVLVYVAFNSTAPLYALQLGPGSYSVTSDRLMLTESFDNGTTWTGPVALNTSDNPNLTASAFTAERPWATAVGSTVYVTWTNMTTAPGLLFGTATGSAAVELLASTNGGSTWPATPTTLPVIAGSSGLQAAVNPYPLVLPSGDLVVAYTTNFSYSASYGCLAGNCLASAFFASVVAARSTNNGSSFSLSTIANSTLVAPNGGTLPRAFEVFQDPSPQLAYGASSGQLVVAYSAGEVLANCTPAPCRPWVDSEMIYVDNSSDGGVTWSSAHVALPSTAGVGLFGTYDPSESYNPAIAIEANGTVDLAFTFVNFTLCSPTPSFGTNCGPEQEVLGQSTDNGSTFSGPILVSENWSWQYNNPTAPDGEYATALVAGGELWMAWTTAGCPGWGTALFYNCNFPGRGGGSQVVISHEFQGAGVTLTFSESGLPNGTSWWAGVLGNLRSGLTPATLSVSGMPAGVPVDWTFSGNLSIGYGSRYSGTPSLTGPAALTTNTTVTVTYTQEVLVHVSTTPQFNSPSPTGYYYYCPGSPSPVWNDPACPSMNWNVTPSVGATWVAPGTAVTLNASPIGSPYCGVGLTCYTVSYVNLSFVSWTGTGVGSVNTTSNLSTFVVNHPVNETANFLMLGWCTAFFAPFYTPANQCITSNTTLTFHETGLPNGTTWTVSTSSEFGSATTSNSTAWLGVTGPSTVGIANFQIWTVPGRGGYWLPSTTTISPVILPSPTLVQVNFTFVTSLVGHSFPVDVATSGLPGGLAWSVTFNASYGISSGNSTVLSIASGSYSVTGGTVTGTNGTEYVVTGVDALPEVVNSSFWSNGTAPGAVRINGPTEVVLVYTAKYWLDVAATSGGSAGPENAWFSSGATVALTATASVGYTFTAWSGTGNGATSSSSASPTIHVYGPITELANFVRNGSLGNTVQVTEVGLPATGAAFSFVLNGTGYTANTSTTVTGLENRSYSFQARNATDLGAGRLGVVTGWTTFFTVNPNGTIAVSGSGSIEVNYSVEDSITTSTVGNGTITPSSGWFLEGSVVSVSATPASGWEFASLTTALSYTATSTTTFQVTASGPGSIVAVFELTPTTVTPTYSVAITETGLPSGVHWNVSLTSGTTTTGTGGTEATLTVVGVAAGSYTVTVGLSYSGAGTRFLPGAVGTGPVAVPTTATLSVAFSTEYELTVTAGAGGSAAPGTEWLAAGATAALSATPTQGKVFVGWNGTGSGSYTGSSASPTVTMNGPVSEIASFGPPPSSGSTGSSSSAAFPTLGIVLLVVLLVVGAIVGILLGRRGGGGSRPEPAEGDSAAAPPEEAPAETIYGSEPAPEGDDAGAS